MKHTRRTFLSTLGEHLLDFLVSPASASTPHTLVYISLDGGMDGLSAVVPYGDPDYYAARPNLAIPPPGEAGGALDLDGFFGFHPALQPMKSLFDTGELAVVHAVGAPDADRSHFSARKLLQSGLSVQASRHYTGWLARHLESQENFDTSPFRAITVGRAQHEALRGTRAASALSDSNGFDLSAGGRGDYGTAMRSLYQAGSVLGQQTLDALAMQDALEFFHPYEYLPGNGAVYAGTDLSSKMQQAAQYIRSGMAPEAICINSGGWDHHDNLPELLPAKLEELAAALASFHQDMGLLMQGVTVVVTTEFGRRVAENASQGTDHGRASCMLILGGRVNGGRVYADWPGLAASQLHLGDLQITTDYRVILGEMLVKLMDNPYPERVLEGLTSGTSRNLFN
jgi:uncharacterized protein (DUF1501 family)